MHDSNPVRNPIEKCHVSNIFEDEELPLNFPLRSAVGSSLMYLSVPTGPGITNLCSTFRITRRFETKKKSLGYCENYTKVSSRTINYGIVNTPGEYFLQTYSDSTYARDLSTRKQHLDSSEY